MYKLLIPLVAVLLGTATLLHAQVPVSASIAQPGKANQIKPQGTPEFACTNQAGTFVLGASGANTQSNDLTLDTLFLCFGDSIFINHNADAVLTGDPDPASTPGVGWAFYDCTPTVTGDNLQLVAADPCILLSPTSGLPVLAVGNPEGDVWFFNSGFLQSTYNNGLPVLLHFAPITIDSFGVPPIYESAQVGAPPGPCVNVNTAVQFSVVYLNAITAAGIQTNFGNDCLGKFRIKGGYPEWNSAAQYTIDISLATDSTVKALIHTSPTQFFHGADIIFSVSQQGMYNIVVEDGKSCGFTFKMDMTGCNPVDNLVLTLPELVSPPGSQVCVPITVENYNNIVSNSLSLQWDPTVLQYVGVQNYPPGTDNSPATRNEQLVNQGLLGITVTNQMGTPITIPNGNELLEVCFNVIGQLGDCTPLYVTNLPTQIGIENQQGTQQAITADSGQVCVNFTPLMFTATFIDTICPGPGNTTATLKITAQGGQAPYEVKWRKLPGGASNVNSIPTNGGMYTASGITNGDIEITVTDDNGLGQILIDTITLNLQAIGASLQFTKLPTCFGDSNGVITALPLIGGSAAPDPTVFTYTWTPAAFNENSQTLDSLPAGNTYSVTVSDIHGCTAVASGTLSQPPKLDDQNITITDAACTGVEDGTISLTIEGGTPFVGTQYNFQWAYSKTDTGTTSVIKFEKNNPSILTQLAAGFYYVTVTDSLGCTFIPSAPYEVKNLRSIVINLAQAITNAKCFGSSDGLISINVVSTPPFVNPNFTFAWNPTNGGTQTDLATSSTLAGIPAGTYNVLATEPSGCADTAVFTITEPTKFVLDTAALMNPTCTNMNDGLIRVAGTGGTGLGNTFTYTWNPPATGNPQERTGLVPGTYSVTASDANGCSDSLSFVLMLPPPPTITKLDSTSVKCGSDGCLTVTSPTGTTFLWKNNLGDTVATTAQACNLPGGTYSIEIHDANNCVVQDTFSLGAVVGLYFSDTTITLPTCYGDSNGIVSVGVMGGTTPYNYLWTPSNQMTNTLTQAKAGLYVLKVTDANSCVLADTFQVLDAPRIQYGLTNYLAATCADSCNGMVTLEVYYSFNGGLMPGNFTYLWDDGNTDSIRTNLCPGLHHVTITDPNNCFTIGEVEMQAPDSITATLTTVPVTCFGGSDGSATVSNPAGGNGQPFSYAWETNPTTPTITGLAAGDYDVTVSDKNKCKAVFTATVTEPDSIALTPQIDSITCFGENQGTLSVDIVGGNAGAFTYSWSDGTNLVGTTNPLEMLYAGTYSVTVTDAKGCTGELDNIVLLDPPPVQGSLLPFEPLICNGDETTLNIDTIFGGVGGPYQYSLDFGVTLNPDFPINAGGGQHFITYFDRLGCDFTDSLDIAEPDPILVTFDPATVEIELGDSLVLEPVITGVASLDSLNYVWSPEEFLLHLPSLTPTAYTFESQAFTLVVTDENGCVGSGSIVVDVDPNRNVYLPNVFKPGNPRGLNDHFNPVIGRGVERINYMQVYDRWGELMYERRDFFPNGDDFSEGWDGKYGGQFVSPGVFVYVVEARFLDGKVLLYRGDVTVVR